MLIENIFIKKHHSHAGKWIYEGYKRAWQKLGYTVHYYDNLSEIKDFNDEYYLMAIDADISGPETISIAMKSLKTFLYVQPNSFPAPWGGHPNFVSQAPDEAIHVLNSMENVYLWTFGDWTGNHNKWKKVYTIPLAFDSVTYQPIKDEKYSKYDISFIGGWADNGFN